MPRRKSKQVPREPRYITVNIFAPKKLAFLESEFAKYWYSEGVPPSQGLKAILAAWERKHITIVEQIVRGVKIFPLP